MTRAVVCTVLAAQVLVPSVILLSSTERPARFGWQMYAAVVDRPQIDAVHTDGTISSLEGKDLNIHRREFQVDTELLARVCDVRTDVVEFRVREHSAVTTHECAR